MPKYLKTFEVGRIQGHAEIFFNGNYHVSVWIKGIDHEFESYSYNSFKECFASVRYQLSVVKDMVSKFKPCSEQQHHLAEINRKSINWKYNDSVEKSWNETLNKKSQ